MKFIPPILRACGYSFFPKEVGEAAATLHNFMEREGLRNWRFDHVASRGLLEKTERERDDLKAKCKALETQVLRCRIGLRDEFAIAIAGGLAASSQLKSGVMEDEFAMAVYEQADAMLAAREKGAR